MPVGIDIGTAFLVSARKSEQGNLLKTIRNCFLRIDKEDIDMLKSNTSMITIDDENYIIGNDAMGFAALNADIRRPMKDGIINPNEEDSVIILREMIKMLVGAPLYEKETACASIPADTADGKVNAIHHQKIVKKIFEDLGYEFLDINEGLAVIYSNNPTITDENDEVVPFSGIGISMGGGMVNVCYSHRGKKQLSFSIARSGDWIDVEASKNFPLNPDGSQSMSPSKVSRFKEEYFSLTKDAEDYTEEELEKLGFKNKAQKRKFIRTHSIISSYYDNLINYILDEFVIQIKKSKLEPEHELEIILSGGTSMPEGLDERFTKILKQYDDFPFVIKNVRKSKDPLNSTALGALNKAIIQEKKKS